MKQGAKPSFLKKIFRETGRIFYRKKKTPSGVKHYILGLCLLRKKNKSCDLALQGIQEQLESQERRLALLEKKISDTSYLSEKALFFQSRMLMELLLANNARKNEKNPFHLDDLLASAHSFNCSIWDKERGYLLATIPLLFEKDIKFTLTDKDETVVADGYGIWGSQAYEGSLSVVKNALFSGKPLLIFEGGFLFAGDCTWGYDPEKIKYRRALSFTIDDLSPYYDCRNTNRLELMLNDPSLSLTEEQAARARKAMEKIVSSKLTKYNHQPIFTPNIGSPGKKKVLVVDQSYGDLSIIKGGASDETFTLMLQKAIDDNPDADILIKTHPDTVAGAKGYYTSVPARDNVYKIVDNINPISLISYVDKVYVCTTQLGFEALICGKEVHVFGLPFYAGWGLTHDALSCSRRTRTRTLEEIFYITYILYSRYVNPETGKLCELEELMDYLLNLRTEFFAKYSLGSIL